MWVGACLSIFLSRAALACTNIEVLHAWIREPPPVAQVAAGYFTMKNKGGTQASIERVESSCCASVAMHQTQVSGDRIRMSPMDIFGRSGTCDYLIQSRWGPLNVDRAVTPPASP